MLDGYKATAKFCKDGKTCEHAEIQGKWTPVYAQSLVVELDNGLRFITNFRYNHKKAQSAAQVEGSGEKPSAQCNQTMVGIVQHIPGANGSSADGMRNFSAQCFYGVQTKQDLLEKSEEANDKEKGLEKEHILSHGGSAPLAEDTKEETLL